MQIHQLISQRTNIIYRRASTREYCGPCPWCGGDDRFRLWPQENRYWCRQCGHSGDAIQFLRDYAGLSFQEAAAAVGKAPIAYNQASPRAGAGDGTKYPPSTAWQEPAWQFAFDCQAHLMENNTNPRARAWLHSRGLRDGAIWSAGLGYNPADCHLDRREWGLPPEHRQDGRPKSLWLPRGITIPWVIDGQLWGIRIRRPVGQPRYYWIPGGTASGLYNADAISPERATVLVEGELDALTIQQEAGDLVAAVATGSTTAGRHIRWLARLSTAPLVLVAYDADQAGDNASSYWTTALDNAIRWRPWWSDINDLLQEQIDVRRWAQLGLQHGGHAHDAHHSR